MYYTRDLAESLERFNRELPYLVAGRTPPPAVEGLTVAELVTAS